MKDDHNGFLEDIYLLGWLIRLKILTPLSENITRWELLNICTPR